MGSKLTQQRTLLPSPFSLLNQFLAPLADFHYLLSLFKIELQRHFFLFLRVSSYRCIQNENLERVQSYKYLCVSDPSFLFDFSHLYSLNTYIKWGWGGPSSSESSSTGLRSSEILRRKNPRGSRGSVDSSPYLFSKPLASK